MITSMKVELSSLDKFKVLFKVWLDGNMCNAEGDTGCIWFLAPENDQIADKAAEIFTAVQQ